MKNNGITKNYVFFIILVNLLVILIVIPIASSTINTHFNQYDMDVAENNLANTMLTLYGDKDSLCTSVISMAQSQHTRQILQGTEKNLESSFFLQDKIDRIIITDDFFNIIFDMDKRKDSSPVNSKDIQYLYSSNFIPGMDAGGKTESNQKICSFDTMGIADDIVAFAFANISTDSGNGYILGIRYLNTPYMLSKFGANTTAIVFDDDKEPELLTSTNNSQDTWSTLDKDWIIGQRVVYNNNNVPVLIIDSKTQRQFISEGNLAVDILLLILFSILIINAITIFLLSKFWNIRRAKRLLERLKSANINKDYNFQIENKDEDEIGQLISVINQTLENISLVSNESQIIKKILELNSNFTNNTIITYNSSKIISTVSGSITPILGYREEAVIGESIESLIHPDDLVIFREFENKHDRNATQIVRVRKNSGKYAFCELRTSIVPEEVRPETGKYVVTICDITEFYLEKQSLYEKYQGLQKQLDHVVTLGQNVSTSLEANQANALFVKSLHEIIRKLDVGLLNILTYDASGKVLRPKYFANNGAVPVLSATIDIETCPPIRQAIETNETVILCGEKLNVIGRYNREENQIKDYTSYVAIPLQVHNVTTGVVELFSILDEETLRKNIIFFEVIVRQMAQTTFSINIADDLFSANKRLRKSRETSTNALINVVEESGRHIYSHSIDSSKIAIEIGKELGLSEVDLDFLKWGGLLHDIGKISIPISLYNKKTKLSPEEILIIQQHPLKSAEILENIDFLQGAKDILLHHHERWNGTGYPSNLVGTQIPLLARIFAVADVWDAMMKPRPDREAIEESIATEYIASNSGILFDPEVVSAFLSYARK